MAKVETPVRRYTYRDASEFLRERTGIRYSRDTLQKAKLAGEIPAERVGDHPNAPVVLREDDLLTWANGQIRPDKEHAA